MIESPQFYTPREVADLMRVRVATVAAWARQGRIPTMYTVGGLRRYPRADIDRIINGPANAQPDTTRPEGDATGSGRL